MNYSLMLSFSALLLSVFTLISTIPCAREKSSRKEKPVPVLEVTGIENLSNKPPNGVSFLKAGSLDISPYVPPASLHVTCSTGVIKIYFADGRVEIPDGVSLPEAAKMFWDAVGRSYPEFKQAIISQHEKEKKNGQKHFTDCIFCFRASNTLMCVYCCSMYCNRNLKK